MNGRELTEITAEILNARLIAGKYLCQVAAAHMLICGLRKNVAKIGGDVEIAAVVKLVRLEPAPITVHLTALYEGLTVRD